MDCEDRPGHTHDSYTHDSLDVFLRTCIISPSFVAGTAEKHDNSRLPISELAGLEPVVNLVLGRVWSIASVNDVAADLDAEVATNAACG